MTTDKDRRLEILYKIFNYYVDCWENEYNGRTSLPSFLGLTEEEYNELV